MSDYAAGCDSASSDEETTLDDIEKLQRQMENVPRGMFVSGWEDPDSNIGIEEDKTPHETLEREILWAADEGNDIELVEKILEQDASCVNAVDRDGYTPLHRAAYNNRYELAQLLIKYRSNVNAQTEYKWTPLHSACKWNNARLAALLLQHGSDVNALSDGDQTPLHVAATVSNCRNTAATLLFHPKTMADLLNNSNETAEFIAKRTGHTLPIFRMGHSALQVETGIID
ncbi:ankyrin repeat domain-containing protein 49 [Lutzomyia longipalpis]|uniref:ankyrin repeat domain-containing protein 49 n=1 Tax=Lutzomyia longipalpis TaxID=7200 RepID=UPI002483C670|nr:ankyrin repeat domain-containing protein 49 [Lutzomyia longipalpis]